MAPDGTFARVHCPRASRHAHCCAQHTVSVPPPAPSPWRNPTPGQLALNDSTTCPSLAHIDTDMSHVPTTSTTRPAGSLALNESALTGESTPQLKEPLPSLGLPPSTRLNLAEHRACVALGGTKLLQHSAGSQPRSQQPPGGGAVGVVLRTGFHSSQGKLMLSLLDAEGRAHVCGRSVLVGLVFSRCCECTARVHCTSPRPPAPPLQLSAVSPQRRRTILS